MCGTRLAENAEPKKVAKIAILAPSRNFVGLYLRNQGTYRQAEKLLSSNMSYRCPHNMVNIGPLKAEICWRVWSTELISTGFAFWQRYCRAVKQCQPNFAALNRGHHLCSAGRPRWPLAHISSLFLVSSFLFLFGSVRQIKLATRQLFGARYYTPLYRIVSLPHHTRHTVVRDSVVRTTIDDSLWKGQNLKLTPRHP